MKVGAERDGRVTVDGQNHIPSAGARHVKPEVHKGQGLEARAVAFEVDGPVANVVALRLGRIHKDVELHALGRRR